MNATAYNRSRFGIGYTLRDLPLPWAGTRLLSSFDLDGDLALSKQELDTVDWAGFTGEVREVQTRAGFSGAALDGKLGPAKAAGAGEGTGHAGESTTEGDPTAGQQVFEDNCSGCHGLDGHGGNGGPSLAGVTDVEHVVAQVTNGGGGMPAFEDTLSAQQIQDVTAYVTQRVATGR